MWMKQVADAAPGWWALFDEPGGIEMQRVAAWVLVEFHRSEPGGHVVESEVSGVAPFGGSLHMPEEANTFLGYAYLGDATNLELVELEARKLRDVRARITDGPEPEERS